MSTATPTDAAGPMLQGLVENTRRAWADLLSRAVGAACNVQVAPQAAPPADANALCLSLNADGALCGEAALVMESRSAAMLAAKFAGSPNNLQPVQELMRQVIVVAAGEFQKQFGALRVQLAAGALPAWQPHTVLSFLAGNGHSEPLCLYFLLSPQIAASEITAPAAPMALSEALPAGLPSQNLNFLMAIELEVTLRFGQKKLPLRQLVELNSGSLIELDKRVHEPVELLLRDKVVARGEVVIVEGHYGLRVTDVCASPQL